MPWTFNPFTKNFDYYAAVVAPTQEFFTPCTYSESPVMYHRGDHPVGVATSGGKLICTEFRVPHDFTSITNADLVIIAGVTNANARVDFDSDYGSAGEAYNAHSEAAVGGTYAFVLNQILEIDISGVLSAIAPGDQVGVVTKKYTRNFYVLGVRFRYS